MANSPAKTPYAVVRQNSTQSRSSLSPATIQKPPMNAMMVATVATASSPPRWRLARINAPVIGSQSARRGIP